MRRNARPGRRSLASGRSSSRPRNLTSGLLFGVGVAAFLDEAVFHQLLHWHHFYDGSTTEIGLISDGIFHAFGWFATVGGLILLADVNRRQAVRWGRWWGGVLLGTGTFQLYDGVVHHKLLRLHQIRYDVELLPYDLAWNAAAVVLIVAGLVLIVRTRRDDSAQRASGSDA